MPRYAISFDLDNTALKAAGYTQSQISNDLYGKEVKTALASCGFTEHPEGSVYHTCNLAEEDSLTPVVKLQNALRQMAPTVCRYVKSIHLFKMEGWSNITSLIQTAQDTAEENIIPPRGKTADVGAAETVEA
jgi:virulence-associated protein VapD